MLADMDTPTLIHVLTFTLGMGIWVGITLFITRRR